MQNLVGATRCVTLGLVLCGLASPVSADELFIPSDMLLSEKNQGVFIRSNDGIPVTVLLSSNSDILRLPDSVFIPAGKNHALFDVSLHGIGEVQVIANIQNAFWNATTSVYDVLNSDYRILLVFPEKSLTSHIDGLLYIVDDLLNPVHLEDDTVVSLLGANMHVAESVVIPAGKSHVSLSVEIYGDSTLVAYTDSSISERINIDYNISSYVVHLGVAPDLVAPHSFGYVAAWITDDSGNIALLPMPISSRLHVSENDVLSVDGVFASQKKIHLRDGFFYQKIFSHNKGNSTVTVSVPGYGTASKRITVSDYDNVPTSTKNPVENLELETPNYIKTDIFPPVTDSESYLVLSMYRQIDSELYPVYGVESAKFSLVSQKLIHDSLVDFMPDAIKSQSLLVPVYGNAIGNHTISVSSVGIPVSQVTVKITEHAVYDLFLTALPPSRPDSEFRALYTISVVDSSGLVIDPHYTFGDLYVRLLSGEAQFKSNVLHLSKPVTVIYGKSEINYPRITVIAQNQDIASTHHGMLQNNLTIDIQIPDSVHAGESFPVYAYLVVDGKPISLINHYLQSSCNVEGFLFACMSSSQFLIFENSIGFATKSVDVFENTFDKDSIRVDFGDDLLYVGSNHFIQIYAPSDVSFAVVSEIPFDVTNDSITLKPETSGTHDVGILFSKTGYTPHKESNIFTVNDEVLIDITATDKKGVILSTTVNVFYDGMDALVDIPGSFAVKRGTIHLEFLPTITAGTESYILESVMLHGDVAYQKSVLDVTISKPTDIQITYKNIITVNVNGHTELYEYGDVITLEGTSRDMAWFLIRDIFDHWTYMPAGYDIYAQRIEMPAERSFETSIVYRADYSGLLLVMASAVMSVFTFVKRAGIYEILKTYTKR